MSNVDITARTPTELAEMFINMPNEEIRLATPQLNQEQLSVILPYMNEKNTPYWKGKTRAIILGLSDREQLESAGRYLSVPQILDFFESNLLARDDTFNKFLAILVGMKHENFSHLLCDISYSQLQVLLQTSLSEPLQHQLTVFNHEMNNKYTMLSIELEKLYQEIKNLSIENLGRNELIDIKNHINDISIEFNNSIEKMKNALRLAWNTHRPDLIESLNTLKNKYYHTLIHFIGHFETSQGATGLYEVLTQRLYTVFGNPYDLNDPEALSNGEPALEALVKFSIWYLKDYWEIGLLPNIKDLSEIELDPQSHDEHECAKYRDHLFAEVKSNLEKIGLHTLWDLKKAHIYSKKALKEYISEH